MTYCIDIVTNREKDITLVNQKRWLVQNGITYDKVKHIGTFLPLNCGQYNRWRFVDAVDAMAFKLVWVESDE